MQTAEFCNRSLCKTARYLFDLKEKVQKRLNPARLFFYSDLHSADHLFQFLFAQLRKFLTQGFGFLSEAVQFFFGFRGFYLLLCFTFLYGAVPVIYVFERAL